MTVLSTLRVVPLIAAIALYGAAPVQAGNNGVGGVAAYPVFVPQAVFAGGARSPAPTAGRPVAGAAATGTVATGTVALTPQAQRDAVAEAVRTIEEANRSCGQTGAYKIDCLAERLEVATRGLSPAGDLGEARAILDSAAQKLHALAQANPDASLSRGRVRQGDSFVSSRPIIPTDQTRQAEIGAQASAIMAEAETLLLRSASGSADRRAQYQRIAAVVGSSKVLLRST